MGIYNPVGAAKNNKRPLGRFLFLLKQTQPDTPERSAWPIREYTIRKIIKTEFVNTSFYRFLLLCIEASEWGFSQVRKLGSKNTARFSNLRTLKKKY